MARMNTLRINRPSHDEIAGRAYEIFQSRGGEHGHDRDDWLQAEYELMRLPVRKIAELPQPRSRRKNPDHPLLVHVVQQAMRSEMSPELQNAAAQA